MAQAILVHGNDSEDVEQVREDAPSSGLPEVFGEKVVEGSDGMSGHETLDLIPLNESQERRRVVGEGMAIREDIENDVDV